MKRSLLVLTAAVLTVTSAHAQTPYEAAPPAVAPAATPAESTTASPAGADMTCESLAAEAVGLADTVQKQVRAAQRRESAGRFGRGLLSGLGQSAGLMGSLGSVAMAVNPLAGIVASVAVPAIAAGLANSAQPGTAAMAPAGPPPLTPEQQRLNELSDLAEARGC